MKSLVVYFSRTGENYTRNGIKNLVKGNTEVVAEYIRDITNSDMFKIVPNTKYPYNYNECTNIAKIELNNNVRPELTNYLDSIDEYDIIYLGYPNWWGTYPMPVATFLDHYDFSNKIIKPFCTNEGSGIGKSELDLKKTLPKSTIAKGLSIIGSDAINSKQLIIDWLKK